MKRNFRQPIGFTTHRKFVTELEKINGYGKGRDIAKDIGITWFDMNRARKKKIATPIVLEKIETYFNL